MAAGAGLIAKEYLTALLYSVMLAACAAALGIMIALALCYAGFALGVLKANANIDDDAALITVGFGMIGALVGLIAGAVAGWLVIAPAKHIRLASARGLHR